MCCFDQLASTLQAVHRQNSFDAGSCSAAALRGCGMCCWHEHHGDHLAVAVHPWGLRWNGACQHMMCSFVQSPLDQKMCTTRTGLRLMHHCKPERV